MKTLEVRVQELRHELSASKRTLRTLIGWMAQSANSPISLKEANDLLNTLPLTKAEQQEWDS